MRISDWSSDVCSSDLDRLNQLPLGLIGIGLGTILLPTVSRLLSSGRESEAMVTQNRGIELALFLTLPATAAFIAAAGPIVSGLFERGHFDAADRSEEHTSELQSLLRISYAGFCLKKKK